MATARDRVVGRCLPGAAEGYGLNAGCIVRYSTQPFYLLANAGGGGGSSSKYMALWQIHRSYYLPFLVQVSCRAVSEFY
jgi:hypothetical protein